MQMIGGITYVLASTALPIRTHLTVVPRLGSGLQQRRHLSRYRGSGEQDVSALSDHGCALRDTYACSASQRDEQATAVSGTSRSWRQSHASELTDA